MRGPALLLAVLLSVALLAQARAAELEPVTYPVADGATITAWRLQPAGASPHPAVVLLHGCGGLWTTKGEQLTARHKDWAERLAAAGYEVILPDSFRSRGVQSVCREKDRSVTAGMRVADAFGAIEWLASRPDIDKTRIGLMGWSHGGSTVLRSVAAGRAPAGVDFKAAIAFYPGCENRLSRNWRPRLPLTILHGAADNWTSSEACRALGAQREFPVVLYPDANHDFDAPDMPLRQRQGVAYSVNGDGVVTTGTNEPARQDAIKRVTDIFAKM